MRTVTSFAVVPSPHAANPRAHRHPAPDAPRTRPGRAAGAGRPGRGADPLPDALHESEDGNRVRDGIRRRQPDVAYVSSVERPDGERGLTGTWTSTYRRSMQRLEVLVLIPSRGEVR